MIVSQNDQQINKPTSSDLRIAFGQHSSVSWNQTLRLFNDTNIYQTWAWGKAQWGHHQMRHIVIYEGQHVIAAAQARVVKIPFMKFGAAYIPWGPLMLTGTEIPDTYTRLRIMDALFREFTEKRGLHLWIQPHHYGSLDIANETQVELLTKFKITQRSPYHTQIIDLAQDLNVLRSRLKRNWRNHLVKSEKHNLSIHISNHSKDINVFYNIFRKMKSFKSFTSEINVQDIKKIQRYLPDEEKMLVFIAYEGNYPVAGAICTLTGQTSIYLMGASDQRGREINASYYLHWYIIKWLKTNGMMYYDLGGINQQLNPGGHSFKEGFGGREVEFPRWLRTFPTNSSFIIKYLFSNNLKLLHRCFR